MGKLATAMSLSGSDGPSTGPGVRRHIPAPALTPYTSLSLAHFPCRIQTTVINELTAPSALCRFGAQGESAFYSRECWASAGRTPVKGGR